MKRYTIIFVLCLLSLLLVGCRDTEHEVEVTGTVDVEIGACTKKLQETLDTLWPLSEIGFYLSSDVLDEAELFCVGGVCITAEDAREATRIIYKN